MSEVKKLSIICFSGDFDKTVAAFTLATGAAAVNWDVRMFFTFWGLNIIKKSKGRKPLGKGFLARAFNVLMGGRAKLPLSRLNFGGLSPGLMTGMMRRSNVATLEELVSAAKQLGIPLVACEMSMHILGIRKEDLDDNVPEVIGVATFLKYSEDAQVLFI